MSAIAGIVRFDGELVSRHELERMANALAAYGRDRSGTVVSGRAGFAHALMRTTPEDSLYRQPLKGSGGVLLTADLRLDNRDLIVERLGLRRDDVLSWPDSRVLLAAWEKFGDHLWPSLRGPFAVAIWNPRERVLTLARDHLGLNTVVWHRNAQFFAFASMPKGLFALPDVPRELSEEKLADFLVLNHDDHATTMYREVYRLPPAHVATIGESGQFASRRYWSPTDAKPIRFKSDEDYAQNLRFHLDRAVRRQLRSATPVGCFLSGGLDSSSIAALASTALSERSQRLAAFTQVPRRGFGTPNSRSYYTDETPYVELLESTLGNVDVTYVYNDEHDDLAELDRLSLAFEYPVRALTNTGWMLAIPRLAASQNRRVLLSGDLGNQTISWPGWSQSLDHLLHGRLGLAFKQYQSFYRETPFSRWVAFRELFLEPLWSERWAERYRRVRGRSKPWRAWSAIAPDFAEEMQVDERARAAGYDAQFRMRRSERAATLSSVDYAGDWYAAIKAIYGVETRLPAADIDVVEYCWAIPPAQFLAEGVDRSVIRRAMWGLLPPVILANRRIGLQAADWQEKLTRQRERLKAEVADIAASPLARRALDIGRLQRAVENWPTSGWNSPQINREYQFALTRGISTGRFLRWFETQNR